MKLQIKNYLFTRIIAPRINRKKIKCNKYIDGGMSCPDDHGISRKLLAKKSLKNDISFY